MGKGTSHGIRHFHTKAVGVTHPNPDGSNRQRILKRCKVKESLLLVPDPENPYDESAVKVCRKSGQQLGFLSAELAEEVVDSLEEGWRYYVWLADLTGGTRERRTRGANLLVVKAMPDVSEKKLRRYLDKELDIQVEARSGLCGALLFLLAILAVLLFIVLA